MKITYQFYMLALAVVGSSALPQPSSNSAAEAIAQVETPVDGIVPAVAQHHGNSAPTYIPDFNASNVASLDAAHTISHKCIHFTSDNPNWHYANSAPWTGRGQFGHGGKTICVETSNVVRNQGGGAMYIGSEKIKIDATPGGNTKLECYFPNTGKQSNCDMSLVDDYSLSVKCDIKGHKSIGGTKDLWKTGKPCVDRAEEKGGVCVNAQGTAPAQSDVTAFFKEGVDGHNLN